MIRLGQREGILLDLHCWRARPIHDHLDDVESKEKIRISKQLEPSQCAFGDQALLLGVHRFARPAELSARSRLDLDEHQRVPVPTHDVHLAPAARAKVAVQDFVAGPPQRFCREPFAATPKRVPRITRLARHKPPETAAQPLGEN